MTNNPTFRHIADLRPKMQNISCRFIILEKHPPTTTHKKGKITNFLVADQTGSIPFSIWKQDCDYLKGGDIMFLTGGYVSLWKDKTCLYVGNNGTVRRMGEFTFAFSENRINNLEPVRSNK
ncbi:soss complex subunit b [Anaeramoeba flamelloides]|uniref:Soss complex subunit b n=1 Tax=Anaeramoeba flamelloides TaxID=1746091 RepID=A0AAV7Z0T5_9EUKA|nr:soss complex subunit b [Anaeramoeba flamelloides]KAJ6240489.1 soss complex subunit b [Anaeramoeba flamelloides]